MAELLIAQEKLMDNLTGIFQNFKSNIRDNITGFLTEINDKWQAIVIKFDEEHKELERIRRELNGKKFDESNYTNVSVIKNQDKQIREYMNKIKELETKVKFLEKQGQQSNQSNQLTKQLPKNNELDTIVKPIELAEINDNEIAEINDIIINIVEKCDVSLKEVVKVTETLDANLLKTEKHETTVKKPRIRITKKEPTNTVNSTSTTNELKEDVKGSKVGKVGKLGKEVKEVKEDISIKSVKNNTYDILEPDTLEEVDESISDSLANTAAQDLKQKATCKLVKELKNKELRMEQKLIENYAKKLEKSLKKENAENNEIAENAENAENVENNEIEEVNNNVIEPEPEPPIVEIKVADVKVDLKKKKTEIKKKDAKDNGKGKLALLETKPVAPVAPAAPAAPASLAASTILVPGDTTILNEDDIIVQYPDNIPKSVANVVTLEYKNELFYMDCNNNVYQITEDEDIGIFLGLYNANLNKIIPIKH